MLRQITLIYLLLSSTIIAVEEIKPRSVEELVELINIADEAVHIEYCLAGNPRDCIIVAIKYELSAKDELAFDYLKLACDEYNDGVGCYYLYAFYKQIKDTKLSVTYLEKSCQLNIGEACYELVFEKVIELCGDLETCTYYDFSEVPKHRNSLRKLVRKACHLGHIRSCQLLR